MAQSIRVALAMGGGTSQGTFSGVGLTEALKLLVLYGGDGGGPCGDVRIDSAAGASAGSVAVAILLRSLVQPVSEPHEVDTTLKRLHGADYTNAPADIRARLQTLQAAQDLQWRLWARHAYLRALLGEAEGQQWPDRRHEAGFLHRRLLEDMAREYLDPAGANFDAPPLLGRRVLFCCTLANLTPLRADATASLDDVEQDTKVLAALSDALSSSIHRDLRVFDLDFAAAPEAIDPESRPDRWFRCHVGASDPARRLRDLRTADAWGPLAATAMASGAFPFGFAPISLTRYRWEYADLWPKPLGQAEEHVFTYVDGGTFENEPLREAFRLASFLDAAQPTADSRRVVLFVDPNVSSFEDRSLRVPILRRHGEDGKPLPTLQRLAAHVGTMYDAIRNQASSREADGAFQTRRQLRVRDGVRLSLRDAIDPRGQSLQGPRAVALHDLLKRAGETLAHDDAKEILPPTQLTVRAELLRVAAEEAARPAAAEELVALAQPQRIAAFLGLADPATDPAADLWLYLLLCLQHDLSAGLTGRRRDLVIAPIAPLWNPLDAHSAFDLPNEAVGTFAGFMSPTAQRFTWAAGRYCARRFLLAAGLITREDPAPRPVWTWQGSVGRYLEAEFRREVLEALDPLLRRLRAIIDDADVLPLDALAAKLIVKKLEAAIERGLERRDERVTAYELRIVVPEAAYSLLVPGRDQPIGARRESGDRHVIATIAEHVADLARQPRGWRPAWLRIRTFSHAAFCDVELPDATRLEPTRVMANPVLELTINEADGPQRGSRPGHVPAGRWTARDEVEPLDATLFDHPRPARLPDCLVQP